LSLLGGTAKRYAQKASGRARIQALTEMVKAYEEGYGVAKKCEAANAWYPLLNAVVGKVARGWVPGGPKGARDITDQMKLLQDLEKQMPASSTEFWDLAFPTDLKLLKAVVSGTLSAADRKTIEHDYRAAAVRAGTPREVASVTGQIEFLRDIARASNRKPVKQLAESLEELRAALAGKST
jgi:hypothetical protein